MYSKYASCGSCEKLPCDIWRAARDPQMTDEEAESSLLEREECLKMVRQKSSLTGKELKAHIQESCFEESLLYLLPRLTEEGWGFL